MRSSSASSDLTVYYWLEPIARKEADWFLFTAVCRLGLIMSGLARSAEEKERYVQALAIRVKRYLPDFRMVQEREANLEAINEFKEYLQGQRQQFTLKFYPLGTAFQRKVWQELGKIPYGETCSYSDIAGKVDCPKGQRAVGMANNKNPLGIVVPCHRVIGKKGDLTGYAGGLEIKEMLLALENQGKSE